VIVPGGKTLQDYGGGDDEEEGEEEGEEDAAETEEIKPFD
jgi:hypothetical protein